MRVLVLGARDGALARALEARLSGAGHDVVGPLPAEARMALTEQAADVDAAIETYVADHEAKAWALVAADQGLPADAPLVTCCHAASATELAAGLAYGQRVVGFAWLGPWTERETVELARALQTGDDAAEAAAELWRSLDLTPTWVGDGAGLVLTRIVCCLVNEALFALTEGVATADDIDRAMELGTRYPRGPLEWAERLGLPAVLATMEALAEEHGEDRYRPAPLLRRLVAAGRTAVPRG